MGLVVLPSHLQVRATMSKEALRKLLRSNHCFTGTYLTNAAHAQGGDGGWWTYELCFAKHVKQLHHNEDGTVTQISLGVYDTPPLPRLGVADGQALGTRATTDRWPPSTPTPAPSDRSPTTLPRAIFVLRPASRAPCRFPCPAPHHHHCFVPYCYAFATAHIVLLSDVGHCLIPRSVWSAAAR